MKARAAERGACSSLRERAARARGMGRSPMLRAPTLRSLAWVMTTVAFAGACNAISGLDTDYKVNETSGTLGPALDAGRDSPASNPIDSGTGAVDCPPASVFCETFENLSVGSSPFGWGRDERAGGVPEVVAGSGFESGHGLHAKVSRPDECPGSCAVAIWRDVSGGLSDGQTLTVSFRFRVKAADNEYAVIAAVQLNRKEYGLAVYRNPDCPTSNTCLDENDLNGAHQFNGATQYTASEWHRGRVVVARHGLTFGGQVYVDETQVDDRSNDALPSGSPNSVEVGVGAFFTGSNGVVETDLDNVIVTRSP
jgi:hypothetical protein